MLLYLMFEITWQNGLQPFCVRRWTQRQWQGWQTLELECKSLRLAPCAPAKQAAGKEQQGGAGCGVFLRLLVSEHVLGEWRAVHLVGGPQALPLPCCRCEQMSVAADSTWQLTLYGRAVSVTFILEASLGARKLQSADSCLVCVTNVLRLPNRVTTGWVRNKSISPSSGGWEVQD